VLLTGSVLTSDAVKTVDNKLDASEPMVCEESRLKLSTEDPAAAVDGSTDGQSLSSRWTGDIQSGAEKRGPLYAVCERNLHKVLLSNGFILAERRCQR